MSKNAVFISLLFLAACRAAPVIHHEPPTHMTPEPRPTVVSSPVPTSRPSPGSSVLPSPTPSVPQPDGTGLPTRGYTAQDNLELVRFSDPAPDSAVSSLKGLSFNDENDGLIYWVEAGTQRLMAQFIHDFAFGTPHNVGDADPKQPLNFHSTLDAQGNGALAWNLYGSTDLALFASPPALLSARIDHFQLREGATRQGFTTGTLYNLDADALLISQERARTLQDPPRGGGETVIQQVPLVAGRPRLSEKQAVAALPEFYAGETTVLAAHLDSSGQGLLIYKDLTARSRVVWKSLAHFKASGDAQALPELPLTTARERIRLHVVDGNGYLQWDARHLIPIAAYQLQPARLVHLSSGDLDGLSQADLSLNAQGTGLVAWSEPDKATGQSRVWVQKLQNFRETEPPDVLSGFAPGTEVREVKVSVNAQGEGYLAGMSLVCDTEAPCAQRLGRQIWVRRLTDFGM